MIEAMVAWLVEFVHQAGYIGVFIMTFLESTFVPIPAELTMIPAGYLAYQGKMHVGLVFLVSVFGTIAGSLANYWLAMHFGRKFLDRYGAYFFLKPDKLEKIDRYFASHGEVSIFTGRLIPGLRHFISFPAGLARMDLRKFCFYTAVGGGIWMGVLIGLGYLIGGNEEQVHHYVHVATYMAFGAVIGIGGFYIWRHRKAVAKAAKLLEEEIKAEEDGDT